MSIYTTSSIDYWSNQPTDQPWLLNGFKGTWAFSDHDLIPEIIREFLLEKFYDRLGETRKGHIKSIPLDEINAAMNEVWEGPGSMRKIITAMFEMRRSRLSNTVYDTKDPLKGYETPTIESDLGDASVDVLDD